MSSKENKIQKFFQSFSKHKYLKGQIIISGDENPEGIFYLSKGYVRMYSVFENGDELTFNIFKPDTFFPMVWVFTQTKNIYFFQAMTNIEVYKAPQAEVLKFIQKNQGVFLKTVKRIMIGFESLLANTQYVLFGNSHKRVASIISISSKRFGEKQGRAILIKIKLTHKDIANLAGLTRETTTLAILKLKKENYISYIKGKILIVSPEKLDHLVFGKSKS